MIARMVFDLKRLRMLHELSLRGTLAAVAEALSYSPSTVSQQLSSLERDAGVALLEPVGRRVRLTAQGSALARHAAAALDADERIRAELETLGPSTVPVRIAAMQSSARELLPRALSVLTDTAPDLTVTISELPPEVALFELAARTFDLVIAEQYPGQTRESLSGLTRVQLGGDALLLALSAREPHAELADLADRIWVMEPAGTAARQWATQLCRSAGFEPIVRYELADLEAQVRLVSLGHAVGLIPGLALAQPGSPLTLTQLPGSPRRDVFVEMRAGSEARPSITVTLDALRRAFTEVRSTGLGPT